MFHVARLAHHQNAHMRGGLHHRQLTSTAAATATRPDPLAEEPADLSATFIATLSLLMMGQWGRGSGGFVAVRAVAHSHGAVHAGRMWHARRLRNRMSMCSRARRTTQCTGGVHLGGVVAVRAHNTNNDCCAQNGRALCSLRLRCRGAHGTAPAACGRCCVQFFTAMMRNWDHDHARCSDYVCSPVYFVCDLHGTTGAKKSCAPQPASWRARRWASGSLCVPVVHAQSPAPTAHGS